MIEKDELTIPETFSAGLPPLNPIPETRPEPRRVSAVLSTSARDLAYVVFRWKWDILLVVLLALIGSAIYLWLIRGVLYETSAKLLVKLGQEQAPPTTMLGDRTLLISQRPQDVNSEIDILKSTDLLERVVIKLGLDQPKAPDPVPTGLMPRIKYEVRKYKALAKSYYKEAQIRLGLKKRMTPREEAIYVMQLALAVEAYPETNVLNATLRTPIPDGAGDILNGVVDEYLEFRRTVFMDDQSVGYFEDQVNASLEQVRAVEAAITAFETENDFQNLTEQEKLLLATREETRRRLNEAEVNEQLAQMKLDRFRRSDKDNASDFASVGEFEKDSYPAALMLELVTLSKQREELKSGTGASAQQLIRVESQRSAVLAMLEKYLVASQRERQEQHENIQAQFDETSAKLAQIRAGQTISSENQRALKVAQDNYYFYRERLENSIAVSAMQEERIGNVSVIQHAIDPVEPAGVSRVKLFLFAIAFALCAAIGWASVREYFDHTVNTADQLRRYVAAPVLATLPINTKIAKGK